MAAKIPAERNVPRRRLVIVILLGFAGITAWFLWSVYSSSGSFTAKVTGTTVINPATLAVTIQVTNTGTSAATPMCTVDATAPARAYTGVNAGSLSAPVQPGQTMTTVMDVVITGQGARYVTQATVSC